MAMNKKNNQAKSYFSYKNDDIELVEIAQFIRDITNYRVEREWYIVFDKHIGHYLGYTSNIKIENINKIRNPDIIIIDKKTNKLLLVIEIDGGVHDKKIEDTERRNKDYELAGIPLAVINKLEIETTIFDLLDKIIQEKLGGKN